MAAGGDHRGAHPAQAYGPVEGLLAHAQLSGRFSGSDEVEGDPVRRGRSIAAGQEAPMAARRHERRPEPAPRDRTQNRRAAHAEAIC
jgi:hypothetical protein